MNGVECNGMEIKGTLEHFFPIRITLKIMATLTRYTLRAFSGLISLILMAMVLVCHEFDKKGFIFI